MAISSNLAARINNMYANPSTVQEQIDVANAASNLISAPRLVSVSGPIRPNADYRVLLNATSGTPALSLPAGIDGMTFAVAHHPSNSVAWSLSPSGSDTISATLASAMAAKTNGAMQ